MKGQILYLMKDLSTIKRKKKMNKTVIINFDKEVNKNQKQKKIIMMKILFTK